jgi:Winged helix DNA-binding domain
MDISSQRLHNQHLSTAPFEKPADVVRWLGAMQAQDYFGALWAVGLRMAQTTESVVEQAFASGDILRTHAMRPTWHFVAPEDIRWLLALTASRVHAVNAYMYRKLELDPKIFLHSNAALAKALQGGRQLTRDELREVLGQAGIAATGEFRLGYLLMHAELEGLICSGSRRGKQFTYILLDERVPPAKTLTREEALIELTRRFFISHGPATLKDFAWWSGLTLPDAQQGIEEAKSELTHDVMGGQTYWFSASAPFVKKAKGTMVYLLPNYDEYTIGYREHAGVFDPSNTKNLIFSHALVMNGQVAGTWRRTLKKNAVIIETSTFAPLTKPQQQALGEAAQSCLIPLSSEPSVTFLTARRTKC